MESKTKQEGDNTPSSSKTINKKQETEIRYKEITVVPARRFVTLPKDAQYETRTRIGAFAIPGEARAFRSLNEEEIKKYGLGTIGTSLNAPNFVEKTNEFFDNFDVFIDDFTKSLKLKVPVGIVNGKEVSILNDVTAREINAIMRYRHITNHPKVAKDSAQFDEAPHLYIAYIIDPKVQRSEKIGQKDVRKTAMNYYLKLTSGEGSKDKLHWVLEVARRGIKTGNIKDPLTGFVPSSLQGVLDVEKLDKDDKELAIEELQERRPTALVKIFEEPDLEWRALLERMVSLGVLKRQGNVVMNDREAVGSDDAEAIAKMKSTKYGETLVVLKNKLKNASKEKEKEKEVIA